MNAVSGDELMKLFTDSGLTGGTLEGNKVVHKTIANGKVSNGVVSGVTVNNCDGTNNA